MSDGRRGRSLNSLLKLRKKRSIRGDFSTKDTRDSITRQQRLKYTYIRHVGLLILFKVSLFCSVAPCLGSYRTLEIMYE